MKNYHIIIKNKHYGPFTLKELQGQSIDYNTLMWSKGMANWTYASEIPEVHHLLKNIPPLVSPNTKYDYRYTKDIVEVDYKKASWLTAIYIFLHLYAKDYFWNYPTVWIIATTGLSAVIWLCFKKYFDALNDKETGKWIRWVIGGYILFGIINFCSSVVFSWEILKNISRETIEQMFSIVFKLILSPILIIFIVGLKIISINFKHPFPLKRIAISSMIFIPIYMFFTLLEHMPIINQTLHNINNLLLPVKFFLSIFFDVDVNSNTVGYFKISFTDNLIFMIPYYFLLHHFYKVDKGNITPN